MSMKPHSYVVAGIKTTRAECEANGIDFHEQFADNEIISAVYGEDTQDVLIGQILFESDPLCDADDAIELTLNYFEVMGHLHSSGINAAQYKLGLYAMTVWL
jgi:hypothetical protein